MLHFDYIFQNDYILSKKKPKTAGDCLWILYKEGYGQ